MVFLFMALGICWRERANTFSSQCEKTHEDDFPSLMISVNFPQCPTTSPDELISNSFDINF